MLSDIAVDDLVKIGPDLVRAARPKVWQARQGFAAFRPGLGIGRCQTR